MSQTLHFGNMAAPETRAYSVSSPSMKPFLVYGQ